MVAQRNAPASVDLQSASNVHTRPHPAHAVSDRISDSSTVWVLVFLTVGGLTVITLRTTIVVMANSAIVQPESGRQPWYAEDVSAIPLEARELLEQYSKIPPNEVISHILEVRSKAFAICAYACIGQLRFLNTRLANHPSYAPILARLRAGATFLDAGCCFAQELRYLARAGIPAPQLHGFDFEPRFLDFGYDLFRDRDRFRATLLTGDVLAAPGSAGSGNLDTLVGKMDVVFASSFLHLWDWADIKAVATRLVAFTSREAGAVVLGRQLGSLTAGSRSMPTHGVSNYRYNVQSMREFWGEVGKETGTRWEVEGGLQEGAEVTENMGYAWAEPDMRILWWTAVRQ